MKARAILAAAIPAVAILALGAGPASASTNGSTSNSGVHHAGHCIGRGDYAICSAGGNAIRPRHIRIHVRASPNQHVSGAWLVVCSRGSGVGSRSGSFSGMTPRNRTIRQNYRHPDSCTVSADAQLSGTGNWIKLRITYRR
jgi:hypothetical protein